MQIQKLILNYRNFLLGGWASLSEVLAILDWDSSPYFIDEWMQANWELLVERQIEGEIGLLPYGFDHSDRAKYLHTNKKSTHRITCSPREEIEKKYTFLCFTSKVGDGFENGPPFDYVYVEDSLTKMRFSIPLDDLSFAVESLSD